MRWEFSRGSDAANCLHSGRGRLPLTFPAAFAASAWRGQVRAALWPVPLAWRPINSFPLTELSKRAGDQPAKPGHDPDGFQSSGKTAVGEGEREQRPRPGDTPDEEGKPRHFGMKLPVGTNPPEADAPSGGNGRQRRDLTPSERLLHGEEKQVRTDAGYRGIGKRAERAHREVSRRIATNPGRRRTLAEMAKARVRCRELERNSSGLRRFRPDDCPAALAVTGEKRIRNLPDRPCGG